MSKIKQAETKGWTVKAGTLQAQGLFHAYRNEAKTDKDVTLWCMSLTEAAEEALRISKEEESMTDFDNLAHCIKQSAKIREESWAFWDADETKGDYTLHISDAVDKTRFNQQTKTLASLLLFQCWNDALDWADRQIYPVEMAFVEACFLVATKLHEYDNNMHELGNAFLRSANSVRNSLYGFGSD